MGHPFTADSAIAGSCRRTRPAGSTRRQSGDGWGALGVAYGGLMGRPSRPLPVAIDLFQAIQPLGQSGGAEEDTRSAGARPGGTRRYRSHGMLHRRHLHGGEKGGSKVGKTKRGKGTKLMVIADASGLPLAVHTASASPHEVTLVEATLAETITVGRPQRIVGDRAYDSDPLDQQLAAQGIELIAPHRKNRVRPATQDGRALRRYRRRWKIERLFAWMNKYKRTLTRWDRCHERFTAFVHLAFSMILMRRLLRFMK